MITTYSSFKINKQKKRRQVVLVFTFIFLIFTLSTFSQTSKNEVKVTSVTPNPACLGGDITVTFNVFSGSGANSIDDTTIYNVYLSSTPSFSSSNLITTFTTSGVTYCGRNCLTSGIEKTITIPATIVENTTYRILILISGNNSYNPDNVSPQFSITSTPSALTYLSNTISYCVNSAIMANIPSYNGGSPTSFSVSPALPLGLTLNTNTGIITGTPTTATNTANYTVTASNTCGNTSKIINITIYAPPSALNYTSNTVSYCTNSTITANNPSYSGGSPTSFSVSPALPSGLNLNTSTGIITGTPTAASNTTNYTVTASNTCGNTSKIINITIYAPPSISNAGPNQTVCSTNTTLAGNTPTNGIGNWTLISGSGTITSPSNASSTITNLGVGANVFRWTISNGSCSSSISEVIITRNMYNYWNGSANNDWSNNANWSCGAPSAINNLDIIIPTGLTNYPLINSDLTIFSGIEIQNGATLKVDNNGLTITGVLTLNGKIDLQNQSQLVQTNTSTLITAGCSGVIEIDQQGTADNFKYNYWSSPVNSICGTTTYSIAGILRDGTFPNNIKNINFGSAYTYADVKVTPVDIPTTSIKLSTYWMYKYINKPSGDYYAWTPIGKDGILNAGQGFTLKGSNTTYTEQNYTFVGKPNNGDINLTIDSGNQYLIGNPYPSAINADDFIKDNIKQYTNSNGSTYGGNRTTDVFDGNLYFWDHFGGGTHMLKSYEGGYSIYNLSGGTKAASTDELIKTTSNKSTKSAQKWIPVAQGFFITAKDGGQIQFRNSQRDFKKENDNVSQFIRTTNKAANKEQAATVDLTERIYLNFSSPSGFHRQILAAIIPNTTDGFDTGYDALNIESYSEDMSWNTIAGKMVIQAIPNLDNERVLPLELKVASSGIVNISIDLLENLPESIDLYLRDNTTGNLYNLKDQPFEINLNAGVYSNRFDLTFKTNRTLAVEDNNMPESLLNVYINNSRSEIHLDKDYSIKIKKLQLFNMIGQEIFSMSKFPNDLSFNIPINLNTGVYLVKVTTDKGVTLKKILKH